MPNSNDAMDDLIDRLGLRGDKETASPTPVRRPRSLCDSRWRIISASLRENPEGVLSLYLKLPATKLMEIILEITFYTRTFLPLQDGDLKHQAAHLENLEALLKFFRQEHKASTAPSIFLRIPIDEVEKDILSLKVVAEIDRNTSTADFVAAAEAGLRNDPNVDWVARCGGPAYVVPAAAPSDSAP